ncbi:MAG TPA: GNAT family N-acetyltransferase [Acidimicrobiales bacterium]|nr:GNAT family N-acetyltransferase [Acidimicrobiales bacterium]
MARRRFIDLPFRIHGHDPSWVPPLRYAVWDRLSSRHPAGEHQEWALWTAHRHGRPVARIGACIDRLFDRFQAKSWLWVGFFEAFDDAEAAAALFETAWDWGRRHGATTAVGPASFTTNDECGLLVDGFDSAPSVLTTHNPPYYERLWTAAGWEPAMDLWGWRGDLDTNPGLSDRQRRSLDRLSRSHDFEVRELDMKDFDADVLRFFQVYSSAWERNWGFAPMTEAEVRHLAKDLKQIVDPSLVLFAQRSTGETVGAALALPDVNESLRSVRSGRLLPFGWVRLLVGTRRAHGVRVLALGVDSEVRSRALGPLLYHELAQRIMARPHATWAEGSWVLASNTAMNRACEALGGRHVKTWRMYEHQL